MQNQWVCWMLWMVFYSSLKFFDFLFFLLLFCILHNIAGSKRKMCNESVWWGFKVQTKGSPKWSSRSRRDSWSFAILTGYSGSDTAFMFSSIHRKLGAITLHPMSNTLQQNNFERVVCLWSMRHGGRKDLTESQQLANPVRIIVILSNINKT